MAFSLGGVCEAEVGGCAAVEAASVFALGVAFHCPDSTDNCASGDVAIARSHEMSPKQRAHLSVYMYICILSDLLGMHSDLLVTY